MLVTCYRCNKEINKYPLQVRERNFCSNECRLAWWSVWTIKEMNIPGHSAGHKAPHLVAFNKSRKNPMSYPEIRIKVADKLRDRGNGKSYRKIHGRHEHRIVAEKKLGRALEKGEIVHHIDCNERNNKPNNLAVMSRAEHARIHFSKDSRIIQGGDPSCQKKYNVQRE